MPKGNINSNTGNAQIKKNGHTTSGAHGSEYTAQRRYPKSTTEINVK